MDFPIIGLKKAAAIARFIEVLVALFLVSNCLPTAAKFTRDVAMKTISLLSGFVHNPLANFVVFNSIIVVLVLLSRQNPSQPDEDQEQVVFTESEFEIPSSEMALPVVVEEKEKHVAIVEKERQDDPIEEAKRDIRRFVRTQSMNLKRELQRNKSHHELKRSETDIKKNKGGDERAVSDVIGNVDMLSNEEFQHTIEEFIAKQQRFLWAQKMAELE